MKLNRKELGLTNTLPVKIVQFGEGNFLRAFVDYAFQKLNDQTGFNGGIAVVQPIDKGMVKMLNDQGGLYTLFLKGVKEGEVVQQKCLISNIVKGIDPYDNFQEYLNLAKEKELEFVISNTTEAGIAYDINDKPEMKPPNSFPAKLTLLLYERFKYFQGDTSKGLIILPCELINYNADTLKNMILQYIEEWGLGDKFKLWLEQANSFHNTLVDRIVPGYPKDNIEEYNAELLYKDNLLVTAETFFLWVIEGDESFKKKLPFDKTGLNVKVVKNMQPYRTRKVRILNGAHTAMVPFSILYGNETVKQTIDNNFTGNFIRQVVFSEIIETLDMDKAELISFAEEVFDRFRNPFIKHMLSSIALNSVSKFKVRVLPSLLSYVENNKKLPIYLTFAFACLIKFYKGSWKGEKLPVNDSTEVVNVFEDIWKLENINKIAEVVLAQTEFWGQDLNHIPKLTNAISVALLEIENNGIEKAFLNYREEFK
ncbi:tagaturonate reductase [Abyssalbus ytuae]|uniref:Tagaturonate reductase n=1 Tax=Abyssalbus ytuae TaxID=2926907 RepID=A0A9E6ZS18_9FLAO|nr:tagaturonate reductase [Abyssalbus ytuae]UOB17793.1 tagaturonate reductase [Abyssalbus ytuae]